MKKLLIADEDRRMIEGDVNRVYLDIDEPPFEFQITTTVDEAIKEIKRFPYELVLSSEFLPEAVPGKLWDDVLYRGDVLRLLEFCTDNAPRTKVCIVSTLTLDERLAWIFHGPRPDLPSEAGFALFFDILSYEKMPKPVRCVA